MSSPPTGILFNDPRDKPTSTTGSFQPGCYRYFYTTQTTTQSPVYSDGGLTVPLSQPVTAGSDGRFPQIYLVPNTIYRCQLFSATNVLLDDTDPYVSGGGLGLLTATIGPPASGGIETLTVLGSANAATVEITASSTSGQSLGLLVEAGTNNLDYSVLVQNFATTATFLQIFGNGSGNLGPTSTLGLNWNTAGNLTIPLPTSGANLTINSPAAQFGVILNSPTASWTGLQFQENAVQKWSILEGHVGSGILSFFSNATSADQLTISSAGNTTINVPSSGIALTVNGTGTFANPAIRAGSSATAGDILLSGVYSTGSLFNIGSLQSSGASTIGYGVAPQTGAAGYQSSTSINVVRSAISLGEGSSNTIAFYVAPPQTTAIGTAPTTWQNAMNIGSTGNVTINTPTSGTTLTVNTSVSLQAAITVSDGTVVSQWQSTGAAAVWGTTANFIAGIFTNNTTRLQISGGGNVTINNPSSGIALTVVGIDRVAILNTPGATTNSLLRYQENGVSKFSAGWNTGIGYIIYDDAATAYRLTIGLTGTFTIAAPSSGVALTVNGVSTTSPLTLNNAGAANAITITGPAATQIGAFQFTQSGQTAWSIYQPASSNDFRIFGGADRLVITSSGNVTINAPSSGVPLTVNGGGEIASFTTATARGSGNGYIQISDPSGLKSYFGYGGANDSLNIVNALNASMTFYTNNSGPYLQIAPSGGVTVGAPGSGTALAVNGVANSYSIVVTAPNTTGQSDGVAIIAGTNTSDSPFYINNAANNTTYLQVLGSGESAILEQPGFALQTSTFHDIGYVDIPQNLQNVAYATVATDRGKSIDHTSGSAHTYTINDATVNYPIGTSISFDNGGSGVVTIALQTTAANLIWCPSGATGNRSLAQYGVATARKISSGTPGVTPGNWHITGVGLS